MYAAENEMLRRTVSELKNSVDAAQNALKNSGTEKIRQDLEEIFASCEKLMSIGAINLQDTMRIAVTYLHARRV
jgi:chromosome condensin MukBEF complex kleisin-like MukF subunit